MEPTKFPVVKNAHIVPRTYLRGFADDQGQIAIRVRGEADSHLTNIRKAGTRGKFYARERPDGTEIHDIEWSLSHVEDRAGMLELGKKVMPLIASLKWTLLEFKGPWLATSDHPVVLWPLGVGARVPQATPHGVGLFEALEYRVPISAQGAILMTWADGPDTRAVGHKDDAASLNAFTVAEASPQSFHLPGVRPPIASGLLTPLSPRVVPGYGDRVAESSPRRARAQQIVQPLIGKNTLRDEMTEVVYIPADSQGRTS